MSSSVHISGKNVAYEVIGSGTTTLVAIPGIGDTRASYRRLAPVLARAGFSVYLMDLRGHGASDVGFDGYRSEDIGDDIVALLESLDLKDVTVVGNSVGAAAGVHAALRSERISRLVSLSGFVSDPPNFALIRPMLSLMFARPWGVAAWGKYRKTLFVTPPTDFESNHADLLANLAEPGRLAAVRKMMCASKSGIAARLHELKIPTLVAMGAGDPDFPDPAAEAARQAEILGGDNSVVMIDGAGHYPQVEQPESTARAIIDFVPRLVAESAAEVGAGT